MMPHENQIQTMLDSDYMNTKPRPEYLPDARETVVINPHMTPQLEDLTKAAQGAAMLTEDIRDAHRRAVYESPFLAVTLLDLLTDASRIQSRLEQLRAIAREAK